MKKIALVGLLLLSHATFAAADYCKVRINYGLFNSKQTAGECTDNTKVPVQLAKDVLTLSQAMDDLGFQLVNCNAITNASGSHNADICYFRR